jgi:protein-S-isoprenylcysteine O-methyltransferase Ste14
MMAILHIVPLVALIAIIVASLMRGQAIKHRPGDHPWAFVSAKGTQRLPGSAFAGSIAVLIAASVKAVSESGSAWSWLAAILAVTGAAIVIVAQIQMGRAWRVGVREGDAPLFIQHGLYKFSRNPIFVGMILIGLGAAIIAGSWWAWVAWVVFVIACALQVRIEESHLNSSFGEAYSSFTRSVPRWIGISQ